MFKRFGRGWVFCSLLCCYSGVCSGDVNATEGETVVLPCSFPEDWTQQMSMSWYIGITFIFEMSANGSKCGRDYCGRADVPKENFLKGECFLILINVTKNDSGNYSVHLGSKFYNVYLSVHENNLTEVSKITNSTDLTHKGEDGLTGNKTAAGVVAAWVVGVVGVVGVVTAVFITAYYIIKKRKGLHCACGDHRRSDGNCDSTEDIELQERLTESPEDRNHCDVVHMGSEGDSEGDEVHMVSEGDEVHTGSEGDEVHMGSEGDEVHMGSEVPCSIVLP